ncbi:peptidoglycan bridge formation glycyltransferase FemA/FemB family protein [Candidatus Daviesbacteria bacterium]|nr:peptidoglycan bridge formation glycyltransferase FemA/FemB family protein [Candidatus Daviesbacteria bacterium]
MDLRPIADKQKSQYNKLVTHVIQSWEWGEFRKSLGLPVLRYGLFEANQLTAAFQLTLHKIPFTNKYAGYLPKGPASDSQLAEALEKIGRKHNCAFIKLEPNIPVIASEAKQSSTLTNKIATVRSVDMNVPRNDKLVDKSFIPSPKPLFTKYNFVLDLTQSEEQILKNMHSKTRYNIKLAQKHEVKVEEKTDDEAFKIYLKLYFETTKRQGYHGHNEYYHQKVWETLKKTGMARLLIASYKNEPLTAWMLLNFKDTLYYPYGGSNKNHPEVMASNLIAWEAITLGKKLKLKKFDMWGALGPDANSKDPWYGFHRFKAGFGGKLIEYIGTYDLVFDWPLYWMFTLIDKLTPLKVFLLKLLGK